MASELVERLNEWVRRKWLSISHANVELIREAATTLSAQEERIERLTDRCNEATEYSIDLQRIIESLCHGREIPVPKTTARHHYEMACTYRAALGEESP